MAVQQRGDHFSFDAKSATEGAAAGRPLLVRCTKRDGRGNFFCHHHARVGMRVRGSSFKRKLVGLALQIATTGIKAACVSSANDVIIEYLKLLLSYERAAEHHLCSYERRELLPRALDHLLHGGLEHKV